MMSRFRQWLGRKSEVLKGSNGSGIDAQDNSLAGQGRSTPGGSEIDGTIVPHAVHESGWALLKQSGNFNIKTGFATDRQSLVLVLGAPNIGKKALVRCVCSCPILAMLSDCEVNSY